MSGFQMVGLPDFRPHSKSIPFATQPVLDHSKSRLGWISDPHCILLYHWSKKPILFTFYTFIKRRQNTNSASIKKYTGDLNNEHVW